MLVGIVVVVDVVVDFDVGDVVVGIGGYVGSVVVVIVGC